MKIRAGAFNKINDIPLNYKFFLVYVVCIIIPTVFVNALFMSKTLNMVRVREEDNIKISADRAISDLKAIFEDCIAMSDSVLVDKELYKILNKNYQDETEYYDDYNLYLRNKMNRYVYTYNFISSLSIYTSNETIGSGGDFYEINDIIMEKPWYKEIKESKRNMMLIAYTENPLSVRNRYYNNLCLVRKLNLFSELQKYEMYLKININPDKIYNIFNREAKYTRFILIDPDGQIAISSGGKYEIGIENGLKNEQSIQYDDNILLFDTDFGNADYLKGWKLICIGDKSKMSNELSRSRIYIIMITLISLGISSMVIYIIVYSYNFRIKKLSKHIVKVHNQQFEPVQVDEGKDEIGELIRNFNRMTGKMNSLVNDVLKLEIQKKNLEIERVRAELNYLQSQMNPHFLFNTLNAVMVECIRNDYSKIVEIITYLSKTLRRLLDWKEDVVTISEEIDFIEIYLKIEKFRFQDKFEYEINVDNNVLYCRIPKMTIQPLVENACKHGLQMARGIGKIKLTVLKNNDELEISVVDNGCGMENDKVTDILEDIHSAEYFDGGSIGLRNVYRRLRLYYGDSLSFDIHSEVNKGTRVCFKITSL